MNILKLIISGIVLFVISCEAGGPPYKYNEEEILELHDRASKNDHEAIEDLAKYYEFHVGANSSSDQLQLADVWIRRAAETGGDDDIVRYANFLIYVKKDCESAKLWHERQSPALPEEEKSWAAVLDRCRKRVAAQ